MSSDKSVVKDFFNLHSSGDEDEGEEVTKGSSKWDWDKPENAHLYPADKDLNIDDDDMRAAMKRRNESEELHEHAYLKKQAAELADKDIFSTPNKPDEDELADFNENRATHRLRFSFTQHKDSVNRIHWCDKETYSHLLLSSSMDR